MRMPIGKLNLERRKREAGWVYGVVFPLAIMSGVTYPSARGGFLGLILRDWGELLLYGAQRKMFFNQEGDLAYPITPGKL